MEGNGECRGVCGEDGVMVGVFRSLLDYAKAMFSCEFPSPAVEKQGDKYSERRTAGVWLKRRAGQVVVVRRLKVLL